MFINHNSATEQNLGFLPALIPFLPIIGTALGIGGQSIAAKQAKAAASKARKAEAAAAAKYAAGETANLTAVQIEAKAKQKRMFVYIAGGVIATSVVGLALYMSTKKKAK